MAASFFLPEEETERKREFQKNTQKEEKLFKITFKLSQFLGHSQKVHATRKRNINAKGDRIKTVLWWECKLVQPLWKSVEVPQKIKNRITQRPSNFSTRNLSKGYKNANSKGHMHPMFISELSTITKLRKKSPNVHQLMNE